jgi:hypothetical protein
MIQREAAKRLANLGGRRDRAGDRRSHYLLFALRGSTGATPLWLVRGIAAGCHKLLRADTSTGIMDGM